jgi:uncharacterized membrane protein YphA (DoxX/SURF4 family)
MNTLQTLLNTGTTGSMVTTTAGKINSRPSPLAVLLRNALGVILVWKGINFIRDTAVLEFLTNQSGESILTMNDAVIILVAGLLTFIFGTFIIAGRFTRMAAFLQLPVFSIGILFIHGGYIERNGFELLLTIVTPFLLLLFIAKGNNVFLNNPDKQPKRAASFQF